MNHYENTGGKLLYLNDGVIISLGLPNISNVIVELEAWQVVIYILQVKVNANKGAGGSSFSFDHQANSRGLLKIQPFGALHPYFT